MLFGPDLSVTHKHSGKRLVFDASSTHTQHHMFLVDGLRVRQGKWDTRSIREQQIYSAQMTPCLEQFLPLYGQNDDQRIYSIVKIKKRAALASLDLQSARMDYMCCEKVLH